DATGHDFPYDFVGSSNPNGVHFDAVGPNTHGGTTYKGYFINTLPGTVFENRGAFSADTLYDDRGVQLVQMFRYYAPEQAYDVWAGKHRVYGDEPSRVEVIGGYASIGGQVGTFRLLKYR